MHTAMWIVLCLSYVRIVASNVKKLRDCDEYAEVLGGLLGFVSDVCLAIMATLYVLKG